MILISNPDKSQWQEILKRPVMNTENLFDTVRSVIDRVKEEGDPAVLDYEEKFDKVVLASLAVSEEEQQEAENLVSEDLKAAIRLAKQNIETFHAAQRFEGKKVQTQPGVTCWQKAVAIEKVDCISPGTASLFSTVLMLAIPARIAGCKEIVLAPLRDVTERYIPLCCLPQKWQVSTGFSKLAAYKPLPLWHTERKVCLRFTRYSVREISMSRLPNSL